MLYWLKRDPPHQTFIEWEFGVSAHAVVDWSSFCREITLDWFIRRKKKLGGEGITVEIDEAKVQGRLLHFKNKFT